VSTMTTTRARAARVFKDNAYSPSTTQDSFPYILLNGRDAQRISLSGPDKLTRLRFGSKGELVSIVQTALQKDGYYEGRIDADFGNRTLRAVLEYQEATFGPSADDGIVGSLTASAFGIDWPD
jgi:peptidoglycan hydrolase-like protein with peptidoglycan-binding domain